MSKIRVGSRCSLLAVRQAEIVISAIKEYNPEFEVELIKIKTKGDKILDRALDKIGGKGLFIKELEQALIDGEIDIAVHSYKDMPYEENEDLPIVALSKREDPFDVLILPDNVNKIDVNKPIGSSSLRRSIQFKSFYPHMEITPIRGNIITRLEKLDRGEFSAIILAAAGIKRADLDHRISKSFTLEEMIPSASQGILAVQGRKDENYSYLSSFNSLESKYISLAERSFLKELNGGCSSPVAAYATILKDEITLTGMYVDNSGNVYRGSRVGTIKNGSQIGINLAKTLRNGGVK